MPRIIFKCPHIKGGTTKAASHLNNYVSYMAMRDGAEHIVPQKRSMPTSQKQKDLVAQIIREFPLSKGLFEYEDFSVAPTSSNASAFITRALEDNLNQTAKKENYLEYIAQRPRAQKMGSHALFTNGNDPIVLSQAADAIAKHPGTVWLPIISLRREDAARLGFDNAAAWKNMLTAYTSEMARRMKIPVDKFRWYAAFHDEGGHPHVHMVCYSEDPKVGFLSKDGIAQIKSGLAKRIFKQDLHEIYDRQTRRRNSLNRDASEVLKQLVEQMQSGTLENEYVAQLMEQLAQRLKNTSGKKQYGYLKVPLKAIVDEIVDELAKDSRVAEAYGLWYDLREEVLRTYKDDLPERLPLSKQKEFKKIKNLVIQEAVRLGALSEVFQPQDQDADSSGTDTWEESSNPDTKKSSAKYHMAKRILTNADSSPEQIAQAVALLTEAAEAGHDGAQYTLAKLFRDGKHVKADRQKARELFQQAAEQDNNSFAAYALGKMLLDKDDSAQDVSAAMDWLRRSAELGNSSAQYALGKLNLLGEDIPQDKAAAVHWFTLAAEQGNEYAKYFLDHMNDPRTTFLLQSVTRLLHHMSRVFQEQPPAPAKGVRFTDKKLRQKIREKKMAQGHKADDHAPEMT